MQEDDVAREKKYRFERKYFIGEMDAAILRQRASKVLSPDPHSDGPYHISSLYFDDVHNTALVQKQHGDLVRNKLRIRYYNHDLDFLRLEHKHKNGDMISKQSVVMTREQYESIKSGDYSFALSRPEPLWHMFYVRRRTLGLAPSVTVDYDREVFIYVAGNVRITFDTNLRASRPFSNISLPAMPPQSIIMELKYDHFLPSIVAGLINAPLTQTTISKYTLCRDTLAHNHFAAS